MELKCPACGSIIHSRRNVFCGVCSMRLPDELLFNAEERAKIERDLAEAKRRARETFKVDDGLNWPPAGGDLGDGVGGSS